MIVLSTPNPPHCISVSTNAAEPSRGTRLCTYRSQNVKFSGFSRHILSREMLQTSLQKRNRHHTVFMVLPTAIALTRKQKTTCTRRCNTNFSTWQYLFLGDKKNKHSRTSLSAQRTLERSLCLTDNAKESNVEVKELVGQLQNLYGQVTEMIDHGAEDSARALINANLEAVTEQLEMGIAGVEQAAVLDILAQLQIYMQDMEAATGMLEKLRKIVSSFGNYEPLLDMILEDMGNMYTNIDKPEKALPLYRRSLEVQQSILGKESPLLVNTLMQMAEAYVAVNEESRSKDLYHQIISILESAKGRDCEELVLPLTDLSHLLIKEWNVKEAEELLRRSMNIMEKLHGKDHAKVGATMCVLARALCAQGKVSEAVSLYQKALDIMENKSGMPSYDQGLERIRTDFAELLHVLGREEEAQKLWEKNLFAQEQIVGSDHPSLAVHLHNLATSYAYSKKFEKCEFLLRRNIRILSDGLSPDAPETTIPMLTLATTLYHLERHNEAETLAQRVLNIREASLQKGNPLIGEACDCLASIKYTLGKYNEAEPLIWKVLQIQEKEFGYDSEEVMSTLEKLFVCLGKLGKENERLPLLQRLGKLKDKYET
eukprot:TRINITY_DN1116_c0_g1_i1.p1 TRINITY_DN1116_c0_g1~~TRINITY_DN1116_c0_g1_i1.p1  ORF type:complete len:599 (-),score=126.89 TRINITY_DN1116_c0_g1_i1:107-1903(-)